MSDDSISINIDELITLYEVEPNIRDIFVEGHFDVQIYSWFLKACNRDNVVVYDISTVKIPDDTIQSHSTDSYKLNFGCNRDKCIALAKELENRTDRMSNNATVIVDKDLDIVLSRNIQCHILLFTDYTCLESYLYQETSINKFLSLGINWHKVQAKQLLGILTPELQELFLVRLADNSLTLGLKKTDFTKCCITNGSIIQFDLGQYITKCLIKSGIINRRNELEKEMEYHRLRLSSEPRNQINGHDFIKLLAWYLHRQRIEVKFSNEKNIMFLLSCCLEVESLKTYPLFTNILTRLN